MTTQHFSEAEEAALSFLRSHGGSVLVTAIPDKNEKDLIFGNVIPGMPVYRKLERKGLVVITEEEPVESLDGFCFTPMVELITGTSD